MEFVKINGIDRTKKQRKSSPGMYATLLRAGDGAAASQGEILEVKAVDDAKFLVFSTRAGKRETAGREMALVDVSGGTP
jgi:hypothetical protein